MEGACCSSGKCSGHINSETMQRLLLENFTQFLEALHVQQLDGELRKKGDFMKKLWLNPFHHCAGHTRDRAAVQWRGLVVPVGNVVATLILGT